MEGTFLGTGLGTDEAAILTLLRGKTPEQIEAIKKAYREKYNKDLVAQMDDELRSGALKTHDADEMHALVEGRTEDARAIEMDRAMRGGWFFGLGTDRQAMEGVYDRIRKETEADAQKYGWDSKTLRAELLKRNQAIDAAYEKQYGKDWTERVGGESALSAAFHDEMQGDELKLIEGLRDDKGLQVDAARIHIEHTSVFYADDKIIRDAMSAEGKRQIADARRDGYLDMQERMDIERGLDEAKVKPASEGPLTEEDRKKGRISELEFLEKWSPEKVQARLAKERKEVDVQAKAKAQANAPANMKALAAEYDSAYVEGTELQVTFDQAVRMDTSGADREAVDALLKKGYLTDAEVVQYAVQGAGTDEDALKEVLAGKTKAEIEAIAEEWAKNNPPDPGDTRTPYQRFRDRLDEDLSGREEFDILDLVDFGEPVTPQEKADRAWRRVDFEARSTNGMASAEYQLVLDQASALSAEVAALERHERMRPRPGDTNYTVDGLRTWQDDWEKKTERVAVQAEHADESVKMHREQVDFVTDRLVNILGAVVMAVVVAIGVVVSIFFPPAGVGFWAAFGAFMASSTVLVGTAVATAAVMMATKAAMKGSAYGWEEAATDAGVGALDALTAAATAGMGSKLLKLGFLARMAEEGGMLARMTAHGLAQGAEGLVQSVPSAFLGNVLNDENYKGGNALFNVLAGTAMQAAPGAVLAGGMGALGGIAKPHVPPRTGDLLHFRGTPQERLTLFKKWKAENPAGNMKEFLREFDDGLIKQLSNDFDKKQLQRAMRKELLEHIPPAQRKAFANTPIELVSEADFQKLTGSKTGQAVTMFRRGKPTIVLKAGADLSELGEEGLHLLQRHDKATRDLVKSLDETALRHWDKLPIEKQVQLYRNKLRLEIEAQESLLASLEGKRGVSMDPAEATRRIQQGEKTLENLRQRMKEVDAFTPLELAEFAQGVRAKPQYLKEPPRLFTKKTGPPGKATAKKAAKKGGGGKKKQAPVLTVTDTEPVIAQTGRANDAWPNTAHHAAHPDVGPFSKKPPLKDDPFIEGAEREVFTQAQRERTTLKLDSKDTVAQIGPAWEEIKPGTTESRYYKLVEVTRVNGEKEYLQLIMSKRSGNRWEVRGSLTTEAGGTLENVQSKKMTEAVLGNQLGPTEKFRRLDFKPLGEAQGSGFDEIIVEFDHAADPKFAKLHVVEVKGGGHAPTLEKFTAVGENLRQNLDELRDKLTDLAWAKAHGLGPAHLEALGKAIDEWQLSIELRIGPKTPLPAPGRDLVGRVERIADAWRKLSLVHAVIPEGVAARAEIETLMKEFKAALHKGRVKPTMKALEKVEKALKGSKRKPGLLAQYNIDPNKLKSLIHSLDPNVKPGEIARITEPFEAAKRVRTIGPTGNILGWGDFDITVSRSWRSRRFKPFELAQMRDLQKGLEAIPELDPLTYGTLSLRDRQQALKKSVSAAMDALGIPKSRRPRVEFQNLAAGDYGWMEWNFNVTPQGRLSPMNRRGVIVINENLDVGDAVGTAVHESRHYYQAYQAYQYSLGRQSHPFSRRWWRNLPGSGGHYYGPGDPRYFRQPIETDAESFGRRVIDLLPPIWPPP
nr:annexin [Corallococcus macrosporus]